MLDPFPKLWLKNMGVENLTYDTWEPILQGLGIRLVGSWDEDYSPGNDHISHLGTRKIIDSILLFQRGFVRFCRRVCFFDEIPNAKR